MPQSLAQIYIHMVFSTKNRTPWLRDRGLRDELYAYMATILRDNVDSPALIINGIEDHIHALVRFSRRFAVMKVMQEAKTETSKWLKRQLVDGPDFAWQAGYGAFSVSASLAEDVKKYIRNQEHHHQRRSFQDEFRELCRLHDVELDERYAWEKGRPFGTRIGGHKTQMVWASQPRVAPRLAKLALAPPWALVGTPLRDFQTVAPKIHRS